MDKKALYSLCTGNLKLSLFTGSTNPFDLARSSQIPIGRGDTCSMPGSLGENTEHITEKGKQVERNGRIGEIKTVPEFT